MELKRKKGFAGASPRVARGDGGVNGASRATRDDRALAATQAAVMKYRLGYSQAEIARRLDVSVMTVSRLLERALRDGIVQITVNMPVETSARLETEVCRRFGLERAIVIRAGLHGDPLEVVARGAAFFLDILLAAGDVMGVAAGRTLMRVIPHLRLPALHAGADLSVVQLMGGFDSPTEHNPVTGLHELAARLGIRGHYLQLPLYAPSQEAAQAMEKHYIRGGFDRQWMRCTLVVTGVGATGESSLYRREGVLSRGQMQEIIAAGAVGDFFGRWFDRAGRFIDTEVNRRVISIPPAVLKALPRKILVAQGTGKIQAIRGVLATGLVDFLVTEEKTAAELLAEPLRPA